ncbi:unnamed protein product [Arctogadus glacialis]
MRLAIFDAGRESLVPYQTFNQTVTTKQGARCHQELALARLTAPGPFPVMPRSTPLSDHQSPPHLPPPSQFQDPETERGEIAGEQPQIAKHRLAFECISHLHSADAPVSKRDS